MMSRKKFLSGSLVVGAGFLAAPLSAAASSPILTKSEATELDAVLRKMTEHQVTGNLDYVSAFRPVALLDRRKSKRGWITAFRATNGCVVELENFGKPVVRFY